MQEQNEQEHYRWEANSKEVAPSERQANQADVQLYQRERLRPNLPGQDSQQWDLMGQMRPQTLLIGF